MTAPRHATPRSRSFRLAIGTALVIGCLFESAASRGASEDPTPDRPATADELQALADKVSSLTEFRAVYDLKSKTKSGVLTLNYRAPGEGHLSIRVTSMESDEVGETDFWLVDGLHTLRIHMAEKNVHGIASFREPFELAGSMFDTLSKRVGGLKREREWAATASFGLNFAKDPNDPDKIFTTAELMYDVGNDPPRVKWFLAKKDWDSARRVGDRIVVELDECVYRFSMETGFLAEATIADRGTATFRELRKEVEADEFVPAKADAGAQDASDVMRRAAWDVAWDHGRRYAFQCIKELDDAEKLDDVRLETWKSVVADHYEPWLPPLFGQVMTAKRAAVDKFIEWYGQRRETAQADAAALETLANDTKTWREKLEAQELDSVDRFAKSLEVPAEVKISSALADRGLDAEREIVRVVGRKVLIEPLLKHLDEGVAAAGERK